MSILIKGMEMPQNCTECRFAVDGWCYAYGRPNIAALSNKERTNFCPLVELPPLPHGRLIDADALMGRIEADTPSSDVFEKLVRRYCNTAPTIIEAEGEE